MVEGTVFIGAVIVGLTEFIKGLAEQDYRTAVLVALSAVVGAVVAAFDTQLDVANLSVAQGIILGLGASGVYKVASKVG